MTNLTETIRAALINLGYEKGMVSVRSIGLNRFTIYIDSQYAGIFDTIRNTFVD